MGSRYDIAVEPHSKRSSGYTETDQQSTQGVTIQSARNITLGHEKGALSQQYHAVRKPPLQSVLSGSASVDKEDQVYGGLEYRTEMHKSGTTSGTIIAKASAKLSKSSSTTKGSSLRISKNKKSK